MGQGKTLTMVNIFVSEILFKYISQTYINDMGLRRASRFKFLKNNFKFAEICIIQTYQSNIYDLRRASRFKFLKMILSLRKHV